MKKKIAVVLATAIAASMVFTGCSKKEDTYPSDSIQIVVPVKAGGDTDANARLLTKYMEKELGVAMPVVNVSGSSGTIGMEQVRSAEQCPVLPHRSYASGNCGVGGLSAGCV